MYAWFLTDDEREEMGVNSGDHVYMVSYFGDDLACPSDSVRWFFC